MHIDPNLLITWGAVSKKYSRNDFIFKENEAARFYFQVLEGKIKLCNFNEDGKEFIQGLFEQGDSFGEPPMFLDEKYPSCAVAITNSIVFKLSKDSLLKLLDDYPHLQKSFIISLSKKIFDKATTAKNIISQNPEHRILAFFDHFKHEHRVNNRIKIPFTRQDIANFTGLRVETVIRTLKKLEHDQVVDIKNRKVYY